MFSARFMYDIIYDSNPIMQTIKFPHAKLADCPFKAYLVFT